MPKRAKKGAGDGSRATSDIEELPRKMVKRLIELGHSKTTYYYENIEGGHGGAANYPQTAYLWTLVFMFLRQKLKLGEA